MQIQQLEVIVLWCLCLFPHTIASPEDVVITTQCLQFRDDCVSYMMEFIKQIHFNFFCFGQYKYISLISINVSINKWWSSCAESHYLQSKINVLSKNYGKGILDLFVQIGTTRKCKLIKYWSNLIYKLYKLKYYYNLHIYTYYFYLNNNTLLFCYFFAFDCCWGYLPEGVARYCFHPVCLCVCVCVCVCVCLYLCVRPIFWYFISRLLEEISISNLYRILIWLYSIH